MFKAWFAKRKLRKEWDCLTQKEAKSLEAKGVFTSQQQFELIDQWGEEHFKVFGKLPTVDLIKLKLYAISLQTNTYKGVFPKISKPQPVTTALIKSIIDDYMHSPTSTVSASALSTLSHTYFDKINMGNSYNWIISQFVRTRLIMQTGMCFDVNVVETIPNTMVVFKISLGDSNRDAVKKDMIFRSPLRCDDIPINPDLLIEYAVVLAADKEFIAARCIKDKLDRINLEAFTPTPLTDDPIV